MKRREVLKKGAKVAWIPPTVAGINIPLHAQVTPACPPYFNDTLLLIRFDLGDLSSDPSGISVTFSCPAFSVSKIVRRSESFPYSFETSLNGGDLSDGLVYAGPVVITVEHPIIKTHVESVEMTTERDVCDFASTVTVDIELQAA